MVFSKQKNGSYLHLMSIEILYPWMRMLFRRLKIIFFVCALVCFSFVMLFGYFCPTSVCYMRAGLYEKYYLKNTIKTVYKSVHSYFSPYEYPDHLIHNNFSINLQKEDVLVFLHIQKTGGTYLGKHLVHNLLIDRPCTCTAGEKDCNCLSEEMKLRSPRFTCKCRKGQKKCACLNNEGNIWLFSRYSTGWACGLHADWTELTSCVEMKMDKKERGHRKRRYHFITILRNPVPRYISEWKHVQRGATWRRVLLKCDGRSATEAEWPSCYDGVDWNGVSLHDFTNCQYNLANNRQTRMIANLSLVNCYNLSAMSLSKRNLIMLQSARQNLENMAFVGLNEHQLYTQYLFHRTFGLYFREIFEQRNMTHSSAERLPAEMINDILRVNDLDLKLYDFAQGLFLRRLQHLIVNDPLIDDETKRKLQKFSTKDFVTHENHVNSILVHVLLKHGSRPISAQERERRERRWKQKLEYDKTSISS